MKSVMAVSMHKAGSTIADRIIAVIAAARGYRIDQLSRQLTASALAEPDFLEMQAPRMTTEGVYYGIARHPGSLTFSMLPKLRVIMQLRDPRDCLTSAYYSFSKSHVPPEDPEKRRAFEARRSKLRSMEIDEHVLQGAENYRRRMQGLANLAKTHPDLVILRYEDMVTDTDAWLQAIAKTLDQPLDDALRARLAPVADFSVAQEDPGQHKRQVTPGDHARKLKPDTIAALNDTLGPVMTQLGYLV